MGMAPPKLPDSVKDYDALITTGRFGGKKKPKNFDAMDYYLHVKGVAALYWSAWAREHPEYHVLTVSPGMTRGTNIGSHEAMPAPFRVMLPVMMKVCGVFGLSHSVSKGAKRYTDAVRHQGSYDQYSSGSFVASVRGASGRVGDQSKHKKGAMYGNVAKQNAAYQAVQAYA